MTIVSHALLIIVANGCLFAAGAGLTRALGAWSHPRELRHALGISLIGGIAAYGVAAQLLYVLGLSLRLWQALALCAALAATGLLGRRKPSRWPSPRPFARLEIVPAALAVLMLLLLGLESIFQPLASWDAWSMWTPKARALVVLNGLDPHVFGNLAYRSWHLDYPLLVPAVEAYAFRFIGIDYRVIHFEQWFFLLGFALAFVDLLRPRVRPVFMWAGLLGILWAPKIGSEMLTANADLPLAMLVGLAGITAFIWITEASTDSLGLLALFAAAAMATKVEGTYLIVILFALTIVYVARRSRRQMWVTAATGAVALVGIVPWRIWVGIHHLPASYSVIAGLEGPGLHQHSRGPIATLVVLGELFSPQAWLLLIPLSLVSVAVLARTGLPYRRGPLLAAVTAALVTVGIVSSLAIPGPSFSYPWRSSDSILFVLWLVAGAPFLIMVARARGPAAWALGTAAAMTGTFITVYVFTPYPFQWHLGTSSSRIILGPALLLAALAPLLLEQAAGNARTPPDTAPPAVGPRHV
jgi:hypothetical protein